MGALLNFKKPERKDPMKHKVVFHTATGYREVYKTFDDFIRGKDPENGGKMVIKFDTIEKPIFDVHGTKIGSKIVATSQDEKEEIRCLQQVARTKGLLSKFGRGFLMVYSTPEKNARDVKRLEFHSTRALRNQDFPKHPKNFDEALLKIVSLSRAIKKGREIVNAT